MKITQDTDNKNSVLVIVDISYAFARIISGKTPFFGTANEFRANGVDSGRIYKQRPLKQLPGAIEIKPDSMEKKPACR